MQEIIESGKTVEEAVEKACEQLGLSRLEVNVEILQMPEKKFFKSIPAKVKVTSTQDTLPDFLKAEQSEKAKPQELKPVSDEKRKETVQQAKSENKKKQGLELDKAVVQKILKDGEEEKEEIAPNENPLVDEAKAYILDIFSTIGVADIGVSVFKQGEFTLFEVSSASLEDAIKIDGDVIQSLSYLIDRAVNKNIDKRNKEYLKIRLDISGFRDRREAELVILVKKTAEEVLKTKRSRTLAPMNSYERLIIHTAIGEIEGLASESIGEDITRRVVIKSTAADATDGPTSREQSKRPPRSGNSNNNNRNRKPSRSGAPKPAYKKSEKISRTYSDGEKPTGEPIVPKRREPIADGEDLPLYGKIEI